MTIATNLGPLPNAGDINNDASSTISVMEAVAQSKKLASWQPWRLESNYRT
jgi:hypothetical protein